MLQPNWHHAALHIAPLLPCACQVLGLLAHLELTGIACQPSALDGPATYIRGRMEVGTQGLPGAPAGRHEVETHWQCIGRRSMMAAVSCLAWWWLLRWWLAVPSQKQQALAQQAAEMAGKPVNLSSPKELAVVLYQDLGLPLPPGEHSLGTCLQQARLARTCTWQMHLDAPTPGLSCPPPPPPTPPPPLQAGQPACSPQTRPFLNALLTRPRPAPPLQATSRTRPMRPRTRRCSGSWPASTACPPLCWSTAACSTA